MFTFIAISFVVSLGFSAHANPLDARTRHCAELLTRLDTADFMAYLDTKNSLGPGARELDNRNLAGTYYDWVAESAPFKILKSDDEILGELKELFAIPRDLQANVGFGRGVRHILAELMTLLGERGYSALLPSDIYPVYDELAKNAGMGIRHFSSIPEVRLLEEGTEPQVVVLTSPLSPSGRALNSGELTNIRAWLSRDVRRRLVLDTVYTFAPQWDKATLELLKNPQVIAIHSLAKAWLLPGHLGFAASRGTEIATLKARGLGPNMTMASRGLALAAHHATLPYDLNTEFRNRWEELAPTLQAIDPDWQPPENGYFSVLPRPASKLLVEQNLWTMPLSTFGSSQSGKAVVSVLPDRMQELYYVTVLSNLAVGFDKYANEFSKAAILKSSFPDKFFLLGLDEIQIGIEKAHALLNKTVPGDRILVIKTGSRLSRLLPNERTGLGRYVSRNHIWVEQLYLTDPKTDALVPVRLEDALADSYGLNSKNFVPYAQIKPRSISLLPIAEACQACCKFCFSEASISTQTQKRRFLDEARIEHVLARSHAAGAERAVITGGGEPTLIGFDKIASMTAQAAKYFPEKVTMISNGLLLGRMNEEERLRRLLQLDEAGLSVLAISRHHYDPQVNKEIMGVDTHTEAVADTWFRNRHRFKRLKLRLICVLQKSGVGDEVEIERYVQWAKNLGVTEINFKELYVATERESAFAASAANKYSEDNRVYLRTVLNYAQWAGWKEVATLPWGAPIFRGLVDGVEMQVAAYTEPSLFWERTNGIARSWNLMADGKLYVSLETGESEIDEN